MLTRWTAVVLQFRLRTDVHISIVVGAFALFIYLETLVPTISGEDSGELITAACVLGIAHPPGYPLWTLLANLCIYIPIGSVAWRVNFMSAVFGAASAGLCSFLTILVTRSRLASFIAGLSLAFSAEFWEQAVVAEVYTLHIFLLFICWIAIVKWLETRHHVWLYFMATSFGLGLCNHHTLVLLAPVLVTVLLSNSQFHQSWHTYLNCILLSLACLSLYLYLPIRSVADPPVDWGNPETLSNFWAVFTRQQYTFALGENPRDLPRLATQLYTFSAQYVQQFSLLISPLPLLGLWSLRRQPIHQWMLAATGLVFSVGVLLVINPDTDRQTVWLNNVFLLPAYAIGAVLIGAAVAQVWEWRRQHIAFAVACGGLSGACILLPLVLNFDAANKSDYWFADDFGRNTLFTMEQNAIYFPTADHATFPVMYLQSVEGQRPDVLIANKYGYPDEQVYQDMPPDQRPKNPQAVTAQEEREVERWVIQNSERPVYFTTRRNMQDLPGYSLASAGLLYRVVRPGEQFGEVGIWDRYTWHTLDPEDAGEELTASFIISDYYFARGRSYLETGEIEHAGESFARAVQAGGETKENLNNVGSACAEAGLLTEAQDYFERALALDPEYEVSLRNLASVFLQQEQHEAALLHLENLLAQEPENVYALKLSVRCLKQIGWKDDAIRRLEFLKNLTPLDSEVLRDLGNLYLEAEHTQLLGRNYLARAFELDPTLEDPSQSQLDPYPADLVPTPPTPQVPQAPQLPEAPAPETFQPPSISPPLLDSF